MLGFLLLLELFIQFYWKNQSKTKNVFRLFFSYHAHLKLTNPCSDFHRYGIQPNYWYTAMFSGRVEQTWFSKVSIISLSVRLSLLQSLFLSNSVFACIKNVFSIKFFTILHPTCYINIIFFSNPKDNLQYLLHHDACPNNFSVPGLFRKFENR